MKSFYILGIATFCAAAIIGCNESSSDTSRSSNLSSTTYNPIAGVNAAGLTDGQLKTLRYAWQYMPKLDGSKPALNFVGGLKCGSSGEVVTKKFDTNISMAKSTTAEGKEAASGKIVTVFESEAKFCVSSYGDSLSGSLSGQIENIGESTFDSKKVGFANQNQGSTESYFLLNSELSVLLFGGDTHVLSFKDLGIAFRFDSQDIEELKEIAAGDLVGLGLESKEEAYNSFVTQRTACSGEIEIDGDVYTCESVIKAMIDYGIANPKNLAN